MKDEPSPYYGPRLIHPTRDDLRNPAHPTNIAREEKLAAEAKVRSDLWWAEHRERQARWDRSMDFSGGMIHLVVAAMVLLGWLVVVLLYALFSTDK